MCLLERATQTLVVEGLVALEVDDADLNFRAAVDVEGDVHALLVYRVVGDDYIDIARAKALLREVLLDEFYVLVDDVVRELGVAAQLEHLLHKILSLRLRYSLYIPLEDAGTLLEEYLQVERVALDGCAYLYVREVARSPQTLHGIRYELAWQIYRVALLQSCRRLQYVVVEVLDAVEVDVAYVV